MLDSNYVSPSFPKIMWTTWFGVAPTHRLPIRTRVWLADVGNVGLSCYLLGPSAMIGGERTVMVPCTITCTRYTPIHEREK